MTQKFIISWDLMHMHCRTLAERQMPAEQWKGIWAVSRGGLVPGAILARELGIRYVDTICISSYDHDHQQDMTVLKAPEGDGEGYLIVEDLVDSGDTARKLRELYPKAKLIAVCAKPSGAELLDDYVVDIAQDTWIEQPWDMTLQYVEPVNRKRK